MKKIRVLVMLLFSVATPNGQILGGIFNQNATQIQYLLQQIAALKVYTDYLQKGYGIAKQGLNTISSIKKGDLNLHHGYFNSLRTVNPTIKKYSKVASILELQKDILKRQTVTLAQLEGSKSLSATELSYISNVLGLLVDDCSTTIDELTSIITDGKLEMKDDERLKRIDNIYADILRKYLFVHAFSRSAESLAATRYKEKTDIEHSRIINGIK